VNFAVGDGWCGHGGAYATNLTIDRQHGLVLVGMEQHAEFPGRGDQSQEAFQQAALKLAT